MYFQQFELLIVESLVTNLLSCSSLENMQLILHHQIYGEGPFRSVAFMLMLCFGESGN
jgi:hypothetical protein